MRRNTLPTIEEIRKSLDEALRNLGEEDIILEESTEVINLGDYIPGNQSTITIKKPTGDVINKFLDLLAKAGEGGGWFAASRFLLSKCLVSYHCSRRKGNRQQEGS